MHRQLRALIVEDNDSDLQLLVRLISKAEYDLDFKQVETATQMRAALETRIWDIVISDFNLPEFSGLKALELLQVMEIDAPFIVVSGTVGEETAVSMMRAGASDYVMKSNLHRLLPAIERELEQSLVRLKRKQAEQALKDSEARYRQISEMISDYAFSFTVGSDSSLNLEWITDGLEKITGYSSRELEKLNWMGHIHPDDLPRVLEGTTRLLAGKSDVSTYQIARKDGTICWLEPGHGRSGTKNMSRSFEFTGGPRCYGTQDR